MRMTIWGDCQVGMKAGGGKSGDRLLGNPVLRRTGAEVCVNGGMAFWEWFLLGFIFLVAGVFKKFPVKFGEWSHWENGKYINVTMGVGR